jgi:hypothetical protein
VLGKLLIGAFLLGAAAALAVVTGLGIALFGLTNSGGVAAAAPELVPFPAEYSPPPGATPKPEPTFSGNVPAAVLLQVPFTTQAPLGNWGPKFYQESCEEAAAVMVHAYLAGNRNPVLEPRQADGELHALVQWQIDAGWGDGLKDLTMPEIGEMMKRVYGFSYKVMEASRDNIRQQLAQGRPIMVPVMTHALNNPNYPGDRDRYNQPGATVYHIVVVKGYDPAGVTLNDPGIGRGQDNKISFDGLFFAIDDVRLRSPQVGQSGRPMLVVAPGG